MSASERVVSAAGRLVGRTPARRALGRIWESLLDAMPGDRLVCRFPGGEQVRLAAAHRQVTWNAQEYDGFRRAVRPGHVVIDVGANLGAYTLLFAQWAGTRGHVHAFEPAPDARRGLERHVALNACADRVTIRPEAISDREGRASFSAGGAQGHSRLVDGAADGVAEAQTVSIDEYCRRLSLTPDVIKVDAEGAELRVLRGARHTIAAAGDRLSLFLELHPGLWPELGTSRAELETELADQGLCLERLDGRPEVWNIEGVCLRVRRCAS